MGQKVFVGNQARNVSGVKAFVNGAVRNITYAKTMINGKIETILYEKKFRDYSWEEIVDLCNKKKIPENWKEGDRKPITFKNGETIDAIIIAKGVDKSALTLSMAKPFSERQRMNDKNVTTGGWNGMKFHNQGITPNIVTYENEFPDIIKKNLKTKANRYIDHYGTGGVRYAVSNDKIWFFSVSELFEMPPVGSYGDEGTWYPYWTPETIPSGMEFWSRTPQPSRIRFGTFNGGAVNYRGPADAQGILFGFCL